jgi:hypothetical protein
MCTAFSRSHNCKLWLDEMHKTNGKPFQSNFMSYYVRAVIQCSKFPIMTSVVYVQPYLYLLGFVGQALCRMDAHIVVSVQPYLYLLGFVGQALCRMDAHIVVSVQPYLYLLGYVGQALCRMDAHIVVYVQPYLYLLGFVGQALCRMDAHIVDTCPEWKSLCHTSVLPVCPTVSHLECC